jgi:predicted secreted protein
MASIMKIYGKDDVAIRAAVGDPFAIELESLPGAGYVWDLHVEGHVVRLVQTIRGVPPRLGGAAVDRFVLSPEAQGEARIVAELKRPWEPSAVERISFHVSVGAAP